MVKEVKVTYKGLDPANLFKNPHYVVGLDGGPVNLYHRHGDIFTSSNGFPVVGSLQSIDDAAYFFPNYEVVGSVKVKRPGLEGKLEDIVGSVEAKPEGSYRSNVRMTIRRVYKMLQSSPFFKGYIRQAERNVHETQPEKIPIKRREGIRLLDKSGLPFAEILFE